MNNEIITIARLTGIDPSNIRMMDDGFWSRGYIINDGEIVFKFKKSPEVSYKSEIRMLNFIHSLNLGIKLQKVAWTSPDDEYLGLYGVVGKSIETTAYDVTQTGMQLGTFLTKLHQANLDNAGILSLDAEIQAWQARFYDIASWSAMGEVFSKNEMDTLDLYVHSEMPNQLKTLGENLVLSHGDLGDGNIFVDENKKVGVIDFNETCYLDEAADFMDVADDSLCRQMLLSYNADKTLREKVSIRRRLRPLIVFGSYAKRNDQEKLKTLVRQIRSKFLE